jgi:hypothetical protein
MQKTPVQVFFVLHSGQGPLTPGELGFARSDLLVVMSLYLHLNLINALQTSEIDSKGQITYIGPRLQLIISILLIPF